MKRTGYNFILVGAPGSGKGTQSVRLEAAVGIKQISSGDILRQAVKDSSPLGLAAKQYMEAGQLVPDELMLDMIRDRIGRPEYDRGFVLDGFPRTLAQAVALDGMLVDVGKTLRAVVVLDVPDAVIVERLSGRRSCPKCGNVHHVRFSPPRVEGRCDRCSAGLVQRPDDVEEKVRVRLEAFHRQTEEVIPYFEARGLLRRVDGLQGPGDVFKAIGAFLGIGAEA